MATGRKRSYHHGDLRAALIDAAHQLIREHGSAGFSLREAARAVGVDPAACYRHFRDREQVLVAIAQDGFAELADATARAREAHRAPRHQLLAMAQAYLSFALERPAQFRLMFGDSGLPARDPRHRSERVERGPFEQLLDVATAQLAGAGPAPAATSAEPFANALWAVAHGVTRLVIDGAIAVPEPEARALLERTITAVLDGMPA
jgi:AcrR family transcriptional regulator